jgi:PhnB protein
MQVQPYLFFDGCREEALEFYRARLDARIDVLMRFRESPEPPQVRVPPGSEDRVMHASFYIGDTMVMASDGYCQGKPAFQGFSLSLSAPDAAGAKRLFSSLADGGRVQMPLSKTFFSPCFGMVADRFGVSERGNVPSVYAKAHLRRNQMHRGARRPVRGEPGRGR